MVVYSKGEKTYERDPDGNYIFHETDKDGHQLQNIEGKATQEPATEFSSALKIKYNDFNVVYEGEFESIMIDGSRLSKSGDIYTVSRPDGRVQDYMLTDYSNDVLNLAREELPNGAMVVYSKGEKTYERDPDGNYIFHETDKDGHQLQNIEGKATQEPATEFSSALKIKYNDFNVVYEGEFESIMIDGSRLSKSGDIYTVSRPDGRVQDYMLTDYSNDVLNLAREELPNGAMVVYSKGEKTYERDSDGNYVAREFYHGNLQSVTEGNGDTWKKIIDNSYYTTSDEPGKQYYLSGQLYIEYKEDGSTFQYAENGLCLYEKNAKGVYAKYQLSPDGKERLPLEKGLNSWVLEGYTYYPSGQLKTKKIGSGYFEYTESGICLYEDINHNYAKYKLTPDGNGRLLTEKGICSDWSEKHSYYPSGKLQETNYRNGSFVKYNEDQTYQKFDATKRLTEEKTAEGKTTYAYYDNTDRLKHICKYDAEGNNIASEYKHFNTRGKENTEYYLAMKRVVAQKLEREEQKAEKEGIPQEDRKVSRKMSAADKLWVRLKARMGAKSN